MMIAPVPFAPGVADAGGVDHSGRTSSALRRRALVLVGALLMCLAVCLRPAFGADDDPPDARRYTALWADAFHPGFKTPEQTEALVAHMRQYNLNTLLFEARKGADAYYDSRLEPRARDIAADYDPLAHAIALCHDTSGGKQRIEVHAWIVAYRVARTGVNNPAGHVLERYEAWKCADSRGATAHERNIFFDPGVPGVIDHTASVAQDIIRHYDVDGLHLDYVRYPDADWGYNPIALKRFQTLYDRSDKPIATDPEWSQFRRDQVTALVRRVYGAVKTFKPKVRVSVAAVNFGGVASRFEDTAPYKQVYQDWAGWLREGCVDIVFLMNYKRELQPLQKRDYADWNAYSARLAAGRQVVIGQGSYLQSAALSISQLRSAWNTEGLAGVCVYSYANPTSTPGERTVFWTSLKNQMIPSRVDPPPALWVEYPRTGLLAGRVTFTSGDSTFSADGARVYIGGEEQKIVQTDGSGFFVFSALNPGVYMVIATDASGRRASGNAMVLAGTVRRLDLSLQN